MAQGGRTVHDRALPHYQRAVIARVKVEGYVLDPAHPVGKHKAIVFKNALGFEQSDWEMLRDLIAAELPYHEAVVGKTDEYGARYNVTGTQRSDRGVLTAWIVEPGTSSPSFVTALVK